MAKKKIVKEKEMTEVQKRMLETDAFYIEKDMSKPDFWPEDEGNTKIDILFNHNGLTINIYDVASSLLIAEICLNKEQTLEALSRMSHTHCNMKTYDLDKIGKKLHIAIFYVNLFQIKEWRDKEKAIEKTIEQCKVVAKDWEPDLFFDSQDSFMKDEKGNTWCKSIIRKYE
jgi:hypothetical protein